MQRFAAQKILTTLACLGLTSCATIEQFLSTTEDPVVEGQRAAIGFTDLTELREIDSYIKLDNGPFRDHIGESLQAQAALSGEFEFSRLRVHFAHQVIKLNAVLRISNGSDKPLKATLEGDVILTFSGGQLVWLPRFESLKLVGESFNFDNQDYSAPAADLEQLLLERVTGRISDPLIVLGRNYVDIAPVPLGRIEVGARLSDLGVMSASGSHDLSGVFTVAGSAILIEPNTTSIALDLEFIPSISSCPSDLLVSRSTFAGEIREREPIGVTRSLLDQETETHYFTEITGATRSTTVIHYWLADGQPVWLEELAVEPSFRWRTWSSKMIDRSQARNWEVIVVEKETGCILHSQAIRVNPAVVEGAVPEDIAAGIEFERFREAFMEKAAGFTIVDGKPDVALIETRRSFLTSVLHDSLKDIRIVVNFDARNRPILRLAGSLDPFNAEQIQCEERACPEARQCASPFSTCVRERDNRECTRCLFRNPLNNRCMNEGTDPICEAAQSARNSRYENQYQACRGREADKLADCQKLALQEVESCRLETEAELAACHGGRVTVREFATSGPFASVQLQLRSNGGLSAIFSDFKIEGDLENIRMNLALAGALEVEGSVRFAPRQNLGMLAECINSWQKSFEGEVVLPYEASSLIGAINTTLDGLHTDWSGYVVRASMKPAPLEALFVDNPGLLAGCHIGLTIDKVLASVTGEAGRYLSGGYDFEVQPFASRIVIPDAELSFGIREFTAPAMFSHSHLKYEVGD